MTGSSSKTEKPWQFKKGQSGNPAGRPKGASDLRKLVLAHAAKRDGNKTNLQHLIERLYKDDPKAYLDRGFGKVVETHEVTGQVEHAVDPAALAMARELWKTR